MIISRRPNSRASSDSAPGPRRTIAAAMVTIKIVVSLVSNKLAAGARNHDKVELRMPSATTTPAMGVRKPTARATPLASSSNPGIQARSAGLPPSFR